MRGRPSKLPKFLEAMKVVLEDPRTVIITDSELLTLVNHSLPKADRVAVSTFEFWKTSNLNKKSPENQLNGDIELITEFREILAYARVTQKMNLGGNILDSTNKNQWGSTWILERKFKDLQLKQTLEIGTGEITLQIEGADTKLIDTIDIDFEVVEVEPILITKETNDEG